MPRIARAAAVLLSALAMACSGGCGPESRSTRQASIDPDWWHGRWVVDSQALMEDPALGRLSPSGQRVAEKLVNGAAGMLIFDLAPGHCVRLVDGEPFGAPAGAECEIVGRKGRQVVLLVGPKAGQTRWTLDALEGRRARFDDGRRTLPLLRDVAASPTAGL